MSESKKKLYRMREIVSRLQKYIATYSDQPDYDQYSDTTLIRDMLYGIGVSIDPNEYRCADGFEKFKSVLQPYVSTAGEAPIERYSCTTGGMEADANGEYVRFCDLREQG